DTITQKIGEALKAHDEIRLSTLRLLSSAFNYEFIAKQHKLSEDEELVVVRREAKKRKEAIEAYEKAGYKDRADKEAKELTILQEYLPPETSDEELNKIVDEVIAEIKPTSPAQIGQVIGVVKAKTGGNAEGSKIAELVRSKLTK
ncbi:MAG: GatB/YqeY domain-containing protein, partial [Candidatus Woesebacteria bacterium]|nr:GatB/YqeY domain-containing protein [Candidatus Woesebacteria bacterium]